MRPMRPPKALFVARRNFISSTQVVQTLILSRFFGGRVLERVPEIQRVFSLEGFRQVNTIKGHWKNDAKIAY